jgi:putative ABC transport system permease protein
MSLWARLSNVFRGDRLNRQLDEEIESHIADAIEQGRDPAEARRAFGSPLLRREESRDVRLIPWLDSLRADVVFGWRQLKKRRVTSAAAILSLGLAIGACTSAFRLIDALLLRPLPVTAPEQLYFLSRQGIGFTGKPETFDGWAYPAFERMRDAVKGDAELLAVSYGERVDLTYASDQEMEKAQLQYVSGRMFDSFGLRPAVGSLLTANDDLKLGAHTYAVLSHDYWARRFGQDPKIVGRTFHMGEKIYQIAGVIDGPFTGTETGTVTDIFLPTMMHPAAIRDDSTWHRTLARVRPGVAMEPLRARLSAVCRAFEEERAKGFTGMTREAIDQFINLKLLLEPASAGASAMQHDYRRSLAALGVLVALVLLIACANVSNLMTAQAASRAREMALRVSIGAGRWRLVQLVLVESAVLACFAAATGGVFAWWSVPFVVGRINPPDNPARLPLPVDWRVMGFALALTLAVTCLFGLAPALRASAIRPASALKGGADPHSRRRVMHALIALQVAFCFVVLFVAGLFALTSDRLSHRPMGFSAERLLNLETVALRPQPPVYWEQVAEHLRAQPGVETVALAGFPLLSGDSWNGFVSVNGAPPSPVLAYFLTVSPGWRETMKIGLLEGADLRPSDTSPGVALVNETFVRTFLKGESPLGKSIAKGKAVYRVIGVVRDAPYRHIREGALPAAYVPFNSLTDARGWRPVRNATLLVRTTGNPLALASRLRREVPNARPEFRVSNIRTQEELVLAQTVRERLLAMVGIFFAGVALLLACVGLYGVLDYSVLQRRREIGIRMAIGAQPADIARRVIAEVFAMVLAGSIGGVALGLGSVRYLETLLYQVKATDPAMLVPPWVIVFGAAMMAAVPALVRAVRIDPIATLRAD